MKKQWKSIKGYEGLYLINNIGEIKSLTKFVKRDNGGGFLKEGRILKTEKHNQGYVAITLTYHTIKKKYLVHRLVALAFIKEVKGKDIINHKNGDKKDNRVENLEWCTRSENEKHKYSVLGQIPYLRENPLRCWKGKFGGEHNTAKIVLQCNIDGQVIKEWSSLIEASKSLGLSCTTGISKVLKGKRKTAGGFKWKYKLD